MKTRILTCIAAALLVSTSAFAQSNAEPKEGTDTSACNWLFASGGGPTLLAWGVSVHGNICRMEAPAGFEHLTAGSHAEGYVLCSGGTVLAHDLGFSEGGFAPGVTVLAGPSGIGITLRRFTSDGLWQLDQKFSRDSKENDITILMTLKRLGGAVGDVRLSRVADFDIDNTFGDDQQDKSDRGVWARQIGGAGHAVTLSNITFATPTSTTLPADGIFDVACNPTPGANPTTQDGTSHVTAHFGTMGFNNTKKTTFVYRRQ